MEVVPEVKPDQHDWCRHADPTASCGACKIYQSRPDPCRTFHCMWLLDDRIKDHWFPARAKIVINAIAGPPKTVAFIVDPAYPNRWREEPWFSDIKAMARAGIEGRLEQKWTTLVMIKDQRIPVIGTSRLLRAAG